MRGLHEYFLKKLLFIFKIIVQQRLIDTSLISNVLHSCTEHTFGHKDLPGRAQYPAEGEQPPKTTTATIAEPPADAPPAEEKKPCAADDPDCLPPLTDGDTFSDGQ